MAKEIHKEQTFEEAIESNLLENGGYVQGNSTDFEVSVQESVQESNQESNQVSN